MTNLEAVNHLLNLSIKGEAAYHKGYKSTVEYARRCKAHFGGVGVDHYLKQFARREAADLFKQRKQITSHINKSIGAMLDRPFSKVKRANWNKVLTFEGDEQGARSTQFEADVLMKFTASGLDSYVFDRCRYFSKFDPNTFIAVEFENFDNKVEKARPYPFEVMADMAVDFEFDNHGTLNFLCARQVKQIEEEPTIAADGRFKSGSPQKPSDHKQKKETKELERLTMYRPLQTVVIQELTAAEAKAVVVPEKVDKITGNPVDGQIIMASNGKVFKLIIPLPHGFEKTPAIRVGYPENPEDDGATRVSIFDAGLPYAEKVVKINSELDLTGALLAFPVSIRHQEACDAMGCQGGQLGDGTTCSACQGTGLKKRPTSAAEEIVLPLPDRPEDMMDVSKIIHYAYPPPEAVKLQLELLAFNIGQCKESVFNSQMHTKQEVAQTALYHGIELESIYDTLFPYAQNLGRIWKFIATCCKVFTGQTGEMTAMLKFPQDFKFQSVPSLFAELEQARKSASLETVQLIQERLMERLLVDDPEALERWRVDNRFNMFSGRTDAAIMVLLNSDFIPRWQKVWYANQQELIEQILSKEPGFYQ